MELFSTNTYSNRRQQLCENIQQGLLLFLGNRDEPMNYPSNIYHFRQDSSFLYFFGLNMPNLAATIDVTSGETILWGDDVDLDDIIWMGPQEPLKEKALKIGVNQSAPFSKLKSYLEKHGCSQVQYLPPYRASSKIALQELLGISIPALKEKASVNLIKACVKLRSIKEPCEIEHLEQQMQVGYLMHTAAMQSAQPGCFEQEIAGLLEGISMSGGGMPSFPIILTKNGQTLHNHYHGHTLKENDLLLVDAGCSSSLGYATDHTRTCPVGGKFTQKQKEIYQIVLNANNAAREVSKPGVFYRDAHAVAARTIVEGLGELGLMKGNVDEAVNAGAHALFMPHGLGHMLGLDVHDMEDYGEDYVGYDDEIKRSSIFGWNALRLGRRLQENFVITNEPGIYFIPELISLWQKEQTNAAFINYNKVNEYLSFGGIRLEDDLLIESTGARILGKRIPITPEEVELEVQVGSI